MSADGKLIGSDLARLSVRGSELEQRSARPDRAALRAASRAAGGADRVLAPKAEDIQALLKKLAEKQMRPKVTWREERSPRISRGLLLLLLMLALLVDAWLRRG